MTAPEPLFKDVSYYINDSIQLQLRQKVSPSLCLSRQFDHVTDTRRVGPRHLTPAHPPSQRPRRGRMSRTESQPVQSPRYLQRQIRHQFSHSFHHQHGRLRRGRRLAVPIGCGKGQGQAAGRATGSGLVQSCHSTCGSSPAWAFARERGGLGWWRSERVAGRSPPRLRSGHPSETDQLCLSICSHYGSLVQLISRIIKSKLHSLHLGPFPLT